MAWRTMKEGVEDDEGMNGRRTMKEGMEGMEENSLMKAIVA